ncbi:MAG: BamA/TamA family outer membrane protein [Tidjanibacter sp.]|nr:BamA/TamA family outer membrane protein [Tidjanibacter sp.]
MRAHWQRRLVVVAAAITALIVSACSIRGYIPEGSYILTSNHIEADKSAPKQERIPASEMSKYIKQKPALDIFGIRTWLYLQADSTKRNLWNNILRGVGTPPVIIDSTLTRRSAENIGAYVASRGFFAASEEYSILRNDRKRTAKVVYKTTQREPYRIESISYNIEDSYIQKLLRADSLTLIKSGDILDINALGEERTRLTQLLRSDGFYDFSENNIEFQIDTTLGEHRAAVKLIIKKHLEGRDLQGEPIYTNNPLYRIGTIRVLPDYNATEAATNPDYLLSLDTLDYEGLEIVYHGRRPNIRPSVLRRLVRLRSGSMFNDRRVTNTYENLMGVNYIHSANILFSQQSGEPMRKVTFVGDHWSDTAETTEGVLDCEIRLSPAMRQSVKADLETSFTSRFYGLSATVGYQNQNLFRGAEQIDMSFTFGYEFRRGEASPTNRNSTELGGMVGVTFPQFLFPIDLDPRGYLLNPQTRLEFSINHQYRQFYDRVLSNVSFGYSWANSHRDLFVLRPFDVSMVKVNYVSPDFLDRLQNPYLRDSYTTQMMAGISGSYTRGTQNITDQIKYNTLRVGLATSGNLLSGIQSLVGAPKTDGHYTLFGIRYAQYLRTDLSWAQALPLNDALTFAYRLYGGVIIPYGNSKNESLPADQLFYAGGVNSMRGWSVRTLGPGSSPEVNSGYPSQFGNLRLEANAELRFPLGGIFSGAAFLDAGNVWYTANIKGIPEGAAFDPHDWPTQIALNTGIGLRANLSVLVLRLDWGIQLHDPGKPAGDRWVILHPSFRNTALHFGIGYPF